MEETRNLAFVWLAGLVFVDRTFVKQVEEKGLDAVLENCPFNDITEEEKKAFLTAMSLPSLQEIVQNWWTEYDRVRKSGELMTPAKLGQPWGPYAFIKSIKTA